MLGHLRGEQFQEVIAQRFSFIFTLLMLIFLLLLFPEFCVNMTCRGTKDGTAHLLIQINITSDIKFAKDMTMLNLRRIKTCRKGSPCDIVYLTLLKGEVFISLNFFQLLSIVY